MRESRSGMGFSLETLLAPAIRPFGADELQGNVSPEMSIRGHPDLPHASAGEETLENEVPDACTRLEPRPAGGFVHRIAGIPTVTTRSIMSTGLGITASRADSPQDELTRVVGVSGHCRGGGRSKGSSEQGRDGRRKRPIYEWAPS